MSSEVASTFEQALTMHRSGRLEAAARHYRTVLAAHAEHFDSLHLLGVICAQRGKPAEAARLIGAALNVNPDDAIAHNNLASALKELGRHDEALAHCDEAIALKPDFAEAFNSRGIVLRRLKRLDEAAASYDNAVVLKPDYAEAFNNRGIVLKDLGRLDEALQCHDRAIDIRPDYANCLVNRGLVLLELKRHEDALGSFDRAISLAPKLPEAFNGRALALKALRRPEQALASQERAIELRSGYSEALTNRGNILRELKRLDEALASHDSALTVNPRYANALVNRGLVLSEMGRIDEALASCDRALALDPQRAEALNLRGAILKRLGRFEEALASYAAAIAIRPAYPEASTNRGMVLGELKRIDEALKSYDDALALDPDNPAALLSSALCRLLAGDYKRGWQDFERRWDAPEFPGRRPNISAAYWRGEPVDGRRLLVFSEQGMGDAIQFARFLPKLVDRGAQVTFHSPARLTRLLQPSLPRIRLADAVGPNETFDYQCAMMDLPLRLGTDLTSIPRDLPYLRPEPDLVARWADRIGRHGFRVGVAWQGNPQGKVDEGRSIPLKEFAPLARLPGVRLISLQKEFGLDQLDRLPNEVQIETLDTDFDNGPDAFIDTAAVMESLDLIITSDTSIAHLAGALGRPTWVALKYVPDWRWLLDREDSPWYPTARLFRQRERDDWSTVFSEIEQALRSTLKIEQGK